jgi:hypothetical protein
MTLPRLRAPIAICSSLLKRRFCIFSGKVKNQEESLLDAIDGLEKFRSLREDSCLGRKPMSGTVELLRLIRRLRFRWMGRSLEASVPAEEDCANLNRSKVEKYYEISILVFGQPGRR